jgi:hypothetical protein
LSVLLSKGILRRTFLRTAKMLTKSILFENRPSSYFVSLRELRIEAKNLPYYGKIKEKKSRKKKAQSKSLVDMFLASMSSEQKKAMLGLNNDSNGKRH